MDKKMQKVASHHLGIRYVNRQHKRLYYHLLVFLKEQSKKKIENQFMDEEKNLSQMGRLFFAPLISERSSESNDIATI
jgi:hypothetical protein